MTRTALLSLAMLALPTLSAAQGPANFTVVSVVQDEGNVETDTLSWTGGSDEWVVEVTVHIQPPPGLECTDLTAEVSVTKGTTTAPQLATAIAAQFKSDLIAAGWTQAEADEWISVGGNAVTVMHTPPSTDEKPNSNSGTFDERNKDRPDTTSQESNSPKVEWYTTNAEGQ